VTREVVLIQPDEEQLARALACAAQGSFDTVDEAAVAADLGGWRAVLPALRDQPQGWRKWPDYPGSDSTPAPGLHDKVAAVFLAWWTDPLNRRHWRVASRASWEAGSARFSSLTDRAGSRGPPGVPLWCVHPDRLVTVSYSGPPHPDRKRQSLLGLCACGRVGLPSELNWVGPCCGPCHDRYLEQGHDLLRDPSPLPCIRLDHGGPILDLTLAGGLVAVAQDWAVHLYEARDGGVSDRGPWLRHGDGAVKRIAFSSDKELLAVLHSRYLPASRPLAGSQQSRTCRPGIAVWHVPSARLLASWDLSDRPGTGGAEDLAFIPGERTLAVASRDEITFHDLTTAEAPVTSRRLAVGARRLAFAATGWPMAALPADEGAEEVLLWRRADAGMETLPTRGVLDNLVLTPDGRSLLACLDWGIQDLAELSQDPDGSILPVRLFDLEEGREIAALEPDLYRSVALLPRSRRWLVTGHAEGRIRLWDLDGKPADFGEVNPDLPPLLDCSVLELSWHRGAVRHLAVSADGELLASAATDGVVRLWPLGAFTGRG
jgi:hypothetical protein